MMLLKYSIHCKLSFKLINYASENGFWTLFYKLSRQKHGRSIRRRSLIQMVQCSLFSR